MKTTRIVSASLLAGALSACSAPPPVTTDGSHAPPPTTTPTGTATGTSEPTGPGIHIAGPYVLTFLQTGGIAALHMETVIDTAANKILYGGMRNRQPQAAELSPVEIRELTRVLQDAKIETFHAVKGPPVADAFTYTLSVKLGGRDFVATWQDGATVPESYESVRATVTKLREAKFGNKAPVNAPDR